MKLKFLFLQIFGTIIFFDLSSCKGYTIKQFKFLCSDFDETKLRVKRCELVAKRGRLGLVNFVVDYEGLPEIYLTMKLFYRGTSGKYQPYLIDVDIDACDVTKYASENKMLQRIFQVFDEFDPNLRKGCPLHGPLNISDWEFDKEAEKFWPPVSPDGTFMLYFRGHDSKNHTLGVVRNFIQIKAIGLADMIKIG